MNKLEMGGVGVNSEQTEDEKSPLEKILETIEIRQAQLDLVKSEVIDLERAVSGAEKEEEKKELQIYLEQRKEGQKEVEGRLKEAMAERESVVVGLADAVLLEPPVFPSRELPSYFLAGDKDYAYNIKILHERAQKAVNEAGVSPRARELREFLDKLDKIAPPAQAA